MTETETVGIAQLNSLRKHLKTLNTTADYLLHYNTNYFYKPHPATQLRFHNSPAKERSIVLGTQQGKTESCSREMSFHATGWYPDWYEGLRFTRPSLNRSADFTGWYSSNSSQQVRDGAQQKLFGDISRKDGWGTGAIPLDNLRGFTVSRGIQYFIDTATVAREDGGTSVLQARTYEQSPQMWQSVPVDLLWYDEDPGYDDAYYNEGLGRIISTNGRIIVSLTPLLGTTPIRKRYIEGGPEIFQVRGGLKQALHIPAERHAAIIASFPKHQVAARAEGQELQGEGAVFTTPISQVTHNRRHDKFPTDWPVGWACDWSHGGKHPFVAVFGFLDPTSDTLYINDILKLPGDMVPDLHIARIKKHACWDAPFLWPHDGGNTGDMSSGESIAAIYRRGGLMLPHKHVTFPEGGYSLSAGLLEMEQRFATRRLLIGEWLLHEFSQEYLNYHYDNGKVVRKDDDTLDAIRVLMMGIRFMRPQDELDRRREARAGFGSPQATFTNNWCPWCARSPCQCAGNRQHALTF